MTVRIRFGGLTCRVSWGTAAGNVDYIDVNGGPVVELEVNMDTSKRRVPSYVLIGFAFSQQQPGADSWLSTTTTPPTSLTSTAVAAVWSLEQQLSSRSA